MFNMHHGPTAALFVVSDGLFAGDALPRPTWAMRPHATSAVTRRVCPLCRGASSETRFKLKSTLKSLFTIELWNRGGAFKPWSSLPRPTAEERGRLRATAADAPRIVVSPVTRRGGQRPTHDPPVVGGAQVDVRNQRI